MPGKDESRTVDSICVTGEDKEIVKSHALWRESENSASQVEMGRGEHRGQRIEQRWPATFSQRTSLWSAQPFMGQHDFRERTVVEKVQCDDGSPALRCSAGPGKDQVFGWNNLQVGADHGTAVL